MFTATKDENLSSVKNGTQNFRSTAADTLDETKEDLRNAANRAGRKVRDFLHNAGDELGHARDTVTHQIRTNPMQSSMIALGVGFLLGALLRR